MRNYYVSIDPKVFHNAGHSTPPQSLSEAILLLSPPQNYPMVPENSFFFSFSFRCLCGGGKRECCLDVLSCGNSIGVISGESLLAGQHNNPFLSLLSYRENETETFWMVFLQGFAMMDVRKGERDIVGLRRCTCNGGIAVDVASCRTSPWGNLWMSREVMPSMMPVRLPSHFHNGYWSCWLLSLGGKYNSYGR